jgi:hypothetical protein
MGLELKHDCAGANQQHLLSCQLSGSNMKIWRYKQANLVTPSAILCLWSAQRKARATANISKLHASAHIIHKNQFCV